MKVARLLLFALILVASSLLLVACGSSAPDVAPYAGAVKFEPPADTMKTFKDNLKGVKEAALETYAVKDDINAVRSYYESQFKDKGWHDNKEEIKDAAKQIEQAGGWALAFEKSGKIYTLTMTPATAAAARFPQAENSNVLVVVSGAR